MPACERCWRDAGGNADEYERLLAERKTSPCRPCGECSGRGSLRNYGPYLPLYRECPACGGTGMVRSEVSAPGAIRA